MIDSDNPETYDNFRVPGSPFHRDKYNRIFETIGKKREWRVLEIGCGTGVYTNFLSEDFDDVCAFDISSDMVKMFRKKPGLRHLNVMVADSMKIPVKSGSVDFVMGVSVLHHVPKRSRVLAEVKRVLKPGGCFVFCEPNKLNLLTSLFQLLQKEDAISRFEMRGVLKEKGLEVIALKEILFRNPEISNFLKPWLGFYSRFERIFERLHIGVTLLVVGRK